MFRNTTHWSPGGTKTFRNKSGMLIGDIGSNLQNPSDDICRIYIPDDGKVFIQCDCAGAEALIVAYECENGKFRQLFENGIKPHTFVAMNLFKPAWKKEQPYDVEHLCSLSIPDLSKHPEWKSLSKVIKNNHERYFIGKKTCHCLSDDHEVLTKDGWKKIAEMPKEIAIWSKNGTITFDKVSWNSFDFSGKLQTLKGKTVDQVMTSNHRLISWWGDKWKEFVAEDLTKYAFTSFRIPSSGYYSGSRNLKEEEIKFICAVQADGSYCFNRIQFHISKDRKRRRLKEILSKLGIKYSLVYSDVDDTYRFSTETPDFIREFLPEKKFTFKLLELSENNLDTFLTEIFYWDGHIQHNGSNAHQYFSKELSNVEIVKTIAHLRGKQGTISWNSSVYRLGLSNRKLSSLQKPQTETKIYTGKVYCPTTKTGYFLVRRNGQISITGNSFNYCKTAATFRFDVLKESEGKVVLTLPQSELFEGIYHSLFPEIKKWQKETEEKVKATRELRNLYGHPMYFGSHLTDKVIRESIAWVPQSTVGVIGDEGFVNMQLYVEANGKDWDVLNNKHDSVLIQAPEEEALEAAKILATIMGVSLTSTRGEKFQMKTEVAIGRNWGKYDEEENPEGMKEVSL